MTRRPALVLLISAGVLMALVATFLSGVSHFAHPGPPLASALVLLTALYVLALFLARRVSASGRLSWVVVILLGLLIRVPLLAAPPFLSDDIYRYAWDGRVISSGENPYRYSPSAIELEHLRDADWRKINNPDLRTIYPPFAEAFFAVMAGVAPGVHGLKTGLVLFDLLLALLLTSRAARAPVDRWRLLLYWWHPLPILEFAWSGHVDVLGMMFLTAAFVTGAGAAVTGRQAFLKGAAAGALTGLASLVKFIAIPAAPFIARRRWAPALCGFIVVSALLYAPFLQPGVNVTGSLAEYVSRWRSNDFLFSYLLRPGTALDREVRLTDAKVVAAACVLAIAALVVVFRPAPARAITLVLGAAIVFSPTIHPWYVAWLLPFLTFSFSPAWLYLSLSVLLAYQPLPGYLAGGPWRELWPVKALIFIPFTGLALLELRQHLFAPPGRNGGGKGFQRKTPLPRKAPETA